MNLNMLDKKIIIGIKIALGRSCIFKKSNFIVNYNVSTFKGYN